VAARKLYDEAQLRLVTANDPVPLAGKVTVADQFEASIAGFSDWLPTAPGRRKGPSTCTRYITIVTRFAEWARGRGRTSFAEITKTDLRGWLASLKNGQAAQATKAANWWPIRALYRYLAEEEGLPDISGSITMHAETPPDKITHLDAADVRKLLAACRDAREKAVISVFLDAGVRISEGRALKVTDVMVDDLRSRRLIVTGKGGKVRTVVIGTETAMALRRYLRDRARSEHASAGALWLGKRGPLTICGLDQLIRAIGRRAGLDIHPHLLRHTWAHHYRLNGGQTDNLVYLAGWNGPAMAIQYGRSAAAERAELEARGLSLVDRTRGHRA
jgi:site-specific recombinase XerD